MNQKVGTAIEDGSAAGKSSVSGSSTGAPKTASELAAAKAAEKRSIPGETDLPL